MSKPTVVIFMVDGSFSSLHFNGPTAGKAVVRRKLQRSEVLAFFKALPPCLVGIEACGTAHYWAREIRELGHEVRLMPPS
jgi:transposase